MNKKNKLFLILGILTTIFIFYLSFQTGINSSEISNKITISLYNFLKLENKIQLEQFHTIIRKLAHFSEFFILGIFWSLYYLTKNKKKLPLSNTMIHGLITAIVDEVIQTFIPGRSGEVFDVLIDFSGVLLSVIFIVVIKMIIKIKKRKNNRKKDTLW